VTAGGGNGIARVAVPETTPAAYRAMVAFGQAAEEGLDPVVANLVKVRASQLNGCAFCLDLHATQARGAGESERRLYAVSAWRRAPFFTERERAALELAEAITLLADGPVAHSAHEAAAALYDQVELASLLWTIAAINAWNRIAVATGMSPSVPSVP
jgi:AhpD family alkylhydroperoxidase